jgi:hypothetical protein
MKSKALMHILPASLLIISIAAPLTAGETAGKQLDPSYQIAVTLGTYATAVDAANSAPTVNWNGTEPARMSVATQAFAALELRHYLCKLTKANEQDAKVFPIVALNRARDHKAIILSDLSQKPVRRAVSRAAGREKLASRLAANESFALVPNGDSLLIIGADRVGVLYGVYSLLQRLGMRWYSPGDMGEVVHTSTDLRLPAQSTVEVPKYGTRGFLAWEDRGDRDFYLWMARNRLNLWTIAELHRALLRQLGIHLNAGLHWTFERYLNPDKYMQAHPEWYGLLNGKRQGFKNGFGVNFCTSNKEALDELMRNMIADFSTGDWRDADMLELWPLDNGKWCECENCKRLGSPSDRMQALSLEVNKRLEDAQQKRLLHHPVEVVFNFYHETRFLPTKPFGPADEYKHIIASFPPIGRCFIHYLDDPDCTEYNTEYWANYLTWEKRFPGTFLIDEYYNISTTKSLPGVYRRIMAHEIPMYYRNGARHFRYMHTATRLQGPKRLTNYLMAQLLWNPEADSEQLFSEYLADFYGAGAEDARRFYDRLEYAMSPVQQWKHYRGENGAQGLTRHISRNENELFDNEHLKLEEYHPAKNAGISLGESVSALKECRTIMDSLKSRNLPSEVKLRLAEDDRNLAYSENTVNLYYYLAQAITAARQQNLDEAKRFYRLTLPFAQGLRDETGILQTASSHANAKDGLDASLVEKAYEKLGEQLGVSAK